jgi:hypothetical protein
LSEWRNAENSFRPGRFVRIGSALGIVMALAAGCSSTIHIREDVSGVDTLSVDAKQRMMLVAARKGYGDRVVCTEPMPDALVAKAAVLRADVNISGATGEASGGGGLGAGSSESAASIGFRNQTVQMLRDGYFRLCEAYMNGAISKKLYKHMVANADTFMAVVSALEMLGSQPVAPAVAISAGGVSTAKDSASITPATPANIVTTVTGTSSADAQKAAANAQAVRQIIQMYLHYRAQMNAQIRADEHRDEQRKRAGLPDVDE